LKCRNRLTVNRKVKKEAERKKGDSVFHTKKAFG
jgi:hypothetical protein